MASAKKTRGFDVTCPHCKDTDATVVIDLNDLVECKCLSCDESFSPQQARDMVATELAKWERVVRWVEMASQAMAE